MNVHAQDQNAGSQSTQAASAALTRVFARMPEDVRTSFTQTQLAALDGALDANNPTRHLINFRISMFGLAYLVVLCGSERRSPGRRSVERNKHPLHTPGNIAFLACIALLGLLLGYALRQLVLGG